MALALSGACLAAAAPVGDGALRPYRIDGDAIVAPLADQPGNPERGKTLFAIRQISTCLLCHADPAASPTDVAAIGPALAGVGARLSEGEIRLRIVDPARLNPETIMPSFYVVDGLNRVGRAWRGRPALDAGQIEDLVAWLSKLRTP